MLFKGKYAADDIRERDVQSRMRLFFSPKYIFEQVLLSAKFFRNLWSITECKNLLKGCFFVSRQAKLAPIHLFIFSPSLFLKSFVAFVLFV